MVWYESLASFASIATGVLPEDTPTHGGALLPAITLAQTWYEQEESRSWSLGLREEIFRSGGGDEKLGFALAFLAFTAFDVNSI